MITFRPYKKYPWFDFLDLIHEQLQKDLEAGEYFALLDELEMRKIDSISEGGTYKLKAPAKLLREAFQKTFQQDPNFSSKEKLSEFLELSDNIIN